MDGDYGDPPEMVRNRRSERRITAAPSLPTAAPVQLPKLGDREAISRRITEQRQLLNAIEKMKPQIHANICALQAVCEHDWVEPKLTGVYDRECQICGFGEKLPELPR